MLAFEEGSSLDSSPSVNHDNLEQYMVYFNPIEWGYIIRRQFNLVNTKQSIRLVCDQPYNTNKGKLLKWEGDGSFAELCIKSNDAYINSKDVNDKYNKARAVGERKKQTVDISVLAQVVSNRNTVL